MVSRAAFQSSVSSNTTSHSDATHARRSLEHPRHRTQSLSSLKARRTMKHPFPASLRLGKVTVLYFRQTPTVLDKTEQRGLHTGMLLTYNAARLYSSMRPPQGIQMMRGEVHIHHTLLTRSSVAHNQPGLAACPDQANEPSEQQHYRHYHLRLHSTPTGMKLIDQYRCEPGSHPRLVQLCHCAASLPTASPPYASALSLAASSAPPATIQETALHLHAIAKQHCTPATLFSPYIPRAAGAHLQQKDTLTGRNLRLHEHCATLERFTSRSAFLGDDRAAYRYWIEAMTTWVLSLGPRSGGVAVDISMRPLVSHLYLIAGQHPAVAKILRICRAELGLMYKRRRFRLPEPPPT